MAAALPEATPNGWGVEATETSPSDGAWGAAGDDHETDAARPSYTPAGITKNPGEHGWADKKDAAYDYETFTKSNKELADEAPAQETAEPIGAVGGLLPGQWSSNAAVYEWNDDYGDVGPRFEDLEKQLFGSEFHVRAGIQFDK